MKHKSNSLKNTWCIQKGDLFTNLKTSVGRLRSLGNLRTKKVMDTISLFDIQPRYLGTRKNQLRSTTLHLAFNSVPHPHPFLQMCLLQNALSSSPKSTHPLHSRPTYTLLTEHYTPVFSSPTLQDSIQSGTTSTAVCKEPFQGKALFQSDSCPRERGR